MRLHYSSVGNKDRKTEVPSRIGKFTYAFMLGATLVSAGCFNTDPKEAEIIKRFIQPNTVAVGSPFVTITLVNEQERKKVNIHGGLITRIDSDGIEYDHQTFGGGKLERVKFGELKVEGKMKILVERGETPDTAKVYVLSE